MLHWHNVGLNRCEQDLINFDIHSSQTHLNNHLALYMAPNKLFHNLKRSFLTSSKPLYCPVCNRKFKTKGGLTKHLNSIHPGIDDHDQGSSSTSSEHRNRSVSGRRPQESPLQHHLQSPSSSASFQASSQSSHAAPSLVPSFPNQKKHR